MVSRKLKFTYCSQRCKMQHVSKRIYMYIMHIEITKLVVSNWSSEDDPSMNQQIDFQGSDDDIRSRFEQYLSDFLTSVKMTLFPIEVAPVPNEPPAKRTCSLLYF